MQGSVWLTFSFRRSHGAEALSILGLIVAALKGPLFHKKKAALAQKQPLLQPKGKL
jgi:hypothetical protein